MMAMRPSGATSLAVRVLVPPLSARAARRDIPSRKTDVVETLTPQLSGWLDCLYLASAALLAAASNFSEPRD